MGVGTTDAAWPADVDFVEYVRARQHTLLRGAYLVCADLPAAEEMLEAALVHGSPGPWDEVRDEQPDGSRSADCCTAPTRLTYRPSRLTAHERSLPDEVGEAMEPEEPQAARGRRAQARRPARTARGRHPDAAGRRSSCATSRSRDGGRHRRRSSAYSVATVRRRETGRGGDAPAGRPAHGWTARPGGPHGDDRPPRAARGSPATTYPRWTWRSKAWEEARRRHRAVVRRTVVAVGAVAAAGAVVAVVNQPGSDLW